MTPRVVVMPVDTRGCGHYRLLFPAWALQEQGADVVIDRKGPDVVWDRPWNGPIPPVDARVAGLYGKIDADIVVFQRPTVLYRLDAIRHLQAAGIRVVVEVDDLIDSTHKRHVGHAEFARSAYVHHEILDQCCKEADLVTVTTPALLRRYGHGHGVVIPNYVPALYQHIEADPMDRSVGWSGVVGTHPGDLQQTGGAVGQALAANRDWTFHAVGPADGIASALGLAGEPSATGWLDFEEYIVALAELTVGIVPLEDTAFNRAKSCLKAAEMASVGVPAVMSPTPDNLRLHQRGVGLVAESRGQWARTLTRLIRNPQARADLAGAGREAMADLTYEQHCGEWWDAWTSCLSARVAA